MSNTGTHFMTHSIKEFFLQLSVHHDNSYKLGGNMTHSAYTHQSKNLDIPLHSRPQWTLLCCHLQSLSEATFIMHPFVWGPQWYSLHQNTLAYTQAFQFCHLVTLSPWLKQNTCTFISFQLFLSSMFFLLPCFFCSRSEHKQLASGFMCFYDKT